MVRKDQIKPARISAFFGTFYNGVQSRAVAVLPDKTEQAALNWNDANNYCTNLDKDRYTLPTVDELALIYLNKKFVTDKNSDWFWSASYMSRSISAYSCVYFDGGYRCWATKTNKDGWVKCVRK